MKRIELATDLKLPGVGRIPAGSVVELMDGEYGATVASANAVLVREADADGAAPFRVSRTALRRFMLAHRYDAIWTR